MAEKINPSLALQIVNVNENKAFKRERIKQNIIDIVRFEIDKNPNRHKNDISCIIRACELIENLVKKKYNIDKFDIILKVFNALFGVLQPADIEQLKKAVDAVLACKLIKKVCYRKNIYSYIKKVFIHNFLFREQLISK